MDNTSFLKAIPFLAFQISKRYIRIPISKLFYFFGHQKTHSNLKSNTRERFTHETRKREKSSYHSILTFTQWRRMWSMGSFMFKSQWKYTQHTEKHHPKKRNTYVLQTIFIKKETEGPGSKTLYIDLTRKSLFSSPTNQLHLSTSTNTYFWRSHDKSLFTSFTSQSLRYLIKDYNNHHPLYHIIHPSP